jgi:hypothetical protein
MAIPGNPNKTPGERSIGRAAPSIWDSRQALSMCALRAQNDLLAASTGQINSTVVSNSV